jgi:hypothetical protein
MKEPFISMEANLLRGQIEFSSLSLECALQLPSEQIGLTPQLFGLFFNVSQRPVSHPASPDANKSKAPVWDGCRPVQFAPWILVRLGCGILFLIGDSLLAVDARRRDWLRNTGAAFAPLGFLILMAPIPWDLGPCPDTPQEQTKYRQTFQHDAGNVSHKEGTHALFAVAAPVDISGLWLMTRYITFFSNHGLELWSSSLNNVVDSKLGLYRSDSILAILARIGLN